MPYRFKRKETTPESVRRIVSEQAQQAAAELGGDNPDIHDGVHNARKCFKKIRSVLRLVRAELGEADYRYENQWFREAAHRLSGARDAEAMIETYDKLAERHPDLPECRPLVDLRESLVQRRQRIVQQQQDLTQAAQELAAELQQVPRRLDQWPLKHAGFTAVAPGLKRNDRRGRKTFRRALRKPNDERFHEWRKRVKDHWYHVRLLRRAWPGLMEARVAELKRLSDLLGDDHDLAVLRATLRQEEASLGTGASHLAELAEARQRALRTEAEALGRRLYALPSGCVVDELARLWKAWKRG